jgi:hypothetical protein
MRLESGGKPLQNEVLYIIIGFNSWVMNPAIDIWPIGVGAGDHPIKYRRSSRKYADFKCPYRGDPAGDHPNFAIAF